MMRYCDYIARLIKLAMTQLDSEGFMSDDLIKIVPDYDPSNCSLKSTKKTMIVSDTAGNKYKITVEEA